MLEISFVTQLAYAGPNESSKLEDQTCRKSSRIKTRTGCISCKERRVRCGEERPACRNCCAYGRTCGGYKLFRFVSFDSAQEAQERRLFHYFRHRGVLELGAGSKQSFWNGVVLSASHLEPAVHHLCVATGSLHEGLTSSRAGDIASLQRSRVFALRQYSKPSNLLARSSISPSQLLIACMLFICFEELHTDLGTAAQHLQSGLDMLCKYAAQSDDDRIITKYVQPLFLSLSLQYGPTNVEIAAKASWILAKKDFLDLSKSMSNFTTMEDASESLDSTITSMLSYFDALKNKCDTMTSQPMVLPRLKRILDGWSIEFGRFLSSSETMIDNHNIIARHLQTRCRIALVLLQTFPFEDEMAFDRFEADFQYIVESSREYVSLSHKPITAMTRYMFEFQLRILWPLYILGTRCRHPLLRREAAELLLLYDCQEGPWRSDCIVRAIHVVTEIEESGLADVRFCKDVPRQSRITPVAGTLLGGNNEYIPLSNGKRDTAIRWLQIDYITHGCRFESPKDRGMNLAPWSPGLPLSFALPDRVDEDVFQYSPQHPVQTRRSDMEVLFMCSLDLATICLCI